MTTHAVGAVSHGRCRRASRLEGRPEALRERLQAMSPHRRYHTLNTLVQALVDANRHDRVQALLDEDAWMRARVEAGGFDYGGFRDDLAVAETAFRRMVGVDPVSQEAPVGLRLLVRVALLRAITNSLALEVHPAVVTRALELGVWSSRRAAAVAARIPDPRVKLELCVALLASGRLDATENGVVQEDAIAAAEAQGYETAQVQGLVDLAPLVTGRAQGQLFDVALQLELRQRVRVLAALAPRLPAPLAERLVEDAAREEDVPFVHIVEAVGPHLSGAALARAVARARTAENLEARVRALEVFETIPAEEVAAEVDELVASPDDGRVVWTVRALARHVDDEQRERLAERVRRCRDPTTVAAALVALAGAGGEALRSEGLSAVLALPADDQLWLVAALPASSSDLFQEAVREAVARASLLEDSYEAATLLVALAAKLPHDAVVGVHRRVVEIADRVDEGARAEFLGDLAPHLAPEVLLDALVRVRSFRRPSDRVELLAALAPRLPVDALSEAAGIALELEPGSDRTRAFAAVAPRLGPAEAHACLLEIGGKLSDYDALELLGALAPALPASDRALLLEEAEQMTNASERGPLLAALAAVNHGSDRGRAAGGVLAAVAECPYEYLRDEMLGRVAPLLEGSLLERALDLVLSLADDADGLAAVGQLLRRAGPAAESTVVAEALARVRRLRGEADTPQFAGVGSRAPLAVALAALAPALSADSAAEALELARRIADLPGRAEVLVALAPVLGPERFETMLTAVDEIPVEERPASGGVVLTLGGDSEEPPDEQPLLTGEGERAAVLAALADVGGTEGAAELLDRALRLKAGHLRARTVARLAPHLAEANLVTALESVLSYPSDDGDDRPSALRALAPRLALEQRRRALLTALRLTYQPDRERSVAALVGALSDDPDLAREGLAALTDWRMIPDAVAALAPVFTPEERRQWTGRVSAAEAPASSAVKALVALAAASDDETRDAATANALEIARRAAEPDVLETLAPHAPHGSLLDAALELPGEAEWREDDAPRALALTRLAPFLDGDERARAVEAALELSQARERLRSLTALGSLGEARRALADVLREAGDGDRAAVLALCRTSEALAPPILPDEVVAALAEDVLEVTGRWVWQ